MLVLDEVQDWRGAGMRCPRGGRGCEALGSSSRWGWSGPGAGRTRGSGGEWAGRPRALLWSSGSRHVGVNRERAAAPEDGAQEGRVARETGTPRNTQTHHGGAADIPEPAGGQALAAGPDVVLKLGGRGVTGAAALSRAECTPTHPDAHLCAHTHTRVLTAATPRWVAAWGPTPQDTHRDLPHCLGRSGRRAGCWGRGSHFPQSWGQGGAGLAEGGGRWGQTPTLTHCGTDRAVPGPPEQEGGGQEAGCARTHTAGPRGHRAHRRSHAGSGHRTPSRGPHQGLGRENSRPRGQGNGPALGQDQQGQQGPRTAPPAGGAQGRRFRLLGGGDTGRRCQVSGVRDTGDLEANTQSPRSRLRHALRNHPKKLSAHHTDVRPDAAPWGGRGPLHRQAWAPTSAGPGSSPHSEPRAAVHTTAPLKEQPQRSEATGDRGDGWQAVRSSSAQRQPFPCGDCGHPPAQSSTDGGAVSRRRRWGGGGERGLPSGPHREL